MIRKRIFIYTKKNKFSNIVFRHYQVKMSERTHTQNHKKLSRFNMRIKPLSYHKHKLHARKS